MKTRNSPLDVLNNHKVKEGPFLMAHTTQGILDAMEEYAKQNALSFADQKLEAFTLAAMQGLCADPDLTELEYIGPTALKIAKSTIKALEEEKETKP